MTEPADPPPLPPEAPPALFWNHPGVPLHNTSSSSVPLPAASTTHISVASTDGDTGAVPPVLPARPRGCVPITAAASMFRIVRKMGVLVISAILRLTFSDNPRGHAALILHNGRLQRIEQRAAESRRQIHQHRFVDEITLA